MPENENRSQFDKPIDGYDPHDEKHPLNQFIERCREAGFDGFVEREGRIYPCKYEDRPPGQSSHYYSLDDQGPEMVSHWLSADKIDWPDGTKIEGQ